MITPITLIDRLINNELSIRLDAQKRAELSNLSQEELEDYRRDVSLILKASDIWRKVRPRNYEN